MRLIVLLSALCMLLSAEQTLSEYFQDSGDEISSTHYDKLAAEVENHCPEIKREVASKFVSDNRLTPGEYEALMYDCERVKRKKAKEALLDLLSKP